MLPGGGSWIKDMGAWDVRHDMEGLVHMWKHSVVKSKKSKNRKRKNREG